jgi:dihydropteroate synthase
VLPPAYADLAGVRVGTGLPVVVIGALNLSAASFYPASVHESEESLLAAAQGMVEAGAAIIDVGARSTAPYREHDVTEAEEAGRLGRAIERLVSKLPVPVSADTMRPLPARVALEAGARILNDVSGLADARVAELAARHGASVIVVASPSRTVAGAPAPRAGADAADPVAVVSRALAEGLRRARAAAIPDERVLLDPGIGFFRGEAVAWPEWDVRVLRGLTRLLAAGRPLCVGASRKSFLGALTGRAEPGAGRAASRAAATVAVLRGAAAIRAHDVAPTVDAVRVAERLREAGAP